MATLTITNTFTAGTEAVAAEVNQNFTDVRTFVNSQVVHKDGTNLPFTVTPTITSTASTAVSLANHLTNKAYVDAKAVAEKNDAINNGKPVNVAWGKQGYATHTSQVSVSSTSYTDVASMAFAAVGSASRLYRVSVSVPASGQTASGFVASLAVCDANDNVLLELRQDVRNTTDEWTFAGDVVVSPNAFFGVKLRARTSVGSTAWRVNPTSTRPALLLVEDIGPA